MVQIASFWVIFDISSKISYFLDMPKVCLIFCKKRFKTGNKIGTLLSWSSSRKINKGVRWRIERRVARNKKTFSCPIAHSFESIEKYRKKGNKIMMKTLLRNIDNLILFITVERLKHSTSKWNWFFSWKWRLWSKLNRELTFLKDQGKQTTSLDLKCILNGIWIMYVFLKVQRMK